MIAYTPPQPARHIPVVDLAAGGAAVARAIHEACRDTGFFYVANHGVPSPLAAAELEWTRRFFALPAPAKHAVSWHRSACRRGYEAVATQVLDAGTPPDLKESFYFGRDLGPDHPYVRRGLANHGPNQWPAGFPGFREQNEAYFAALAALSHRLMALLARSLGLPADWFDAMLAEPMPIARLIHYPPHPADAAPNQLGAGAHTDWGALTLLLQDDAGGLEVRNAAGEWIRAQPVPDTFVVNLGDMVARWTNGRYHSNLHRVLNASGRERYSVAFFANPDHAARIECLPTCTDAANPPRHPPCTAGEHIEEMYRLTFAGKRAA
jgi:isopenicillin N synthase-like dioxygenase